MFKLNVGDTPNVLTDADYDKMGAHCEGFSGSDISVAVREVLMEPLRKCQLATHFYMDSNGMFNPCARNKPLPRNAQQMSLYDVPSDKLKVPDVDYHDFEHVLSRCNSSVAPEELTRFEEWTSEFGQEG